MNIVYQVNMMLYCVKTLEITQELIEEIYPDAKPKKVEEILKNIENGTFPIQNIIEHLEEHSTMMDVEAENITDPDPESRWFYFQKEKDRGDPRRSEGEVIKL